MSRIGDRLQRLHKISKPIGFGFGAGTVQPRRMLLIVHLTLVPDGETLDSVVPLADAFVLGPEAAAEASALQAVSSRCADSPVGVWLVPGGRLPSLEPAVAVDFYVCDLDGPPGLIMEKDRGKLVRIESGVEASRLRALAELGVDALVLRASVSELARLSGVVECRRVHTVSGKRVILHVDGEVEASLIAALWRSGVDGLIVDSTYGVELVASLRDAVNSAAYDTRFSESGTFVAIGTQVNALGRVRGGEDDEGDGDEVDDDDE